MQKLNSKLELLGKFLSHAHDNYDETRKEDAPPSVDFSDINFDRIEIEYLIYTPTYKNQDGKEINTIEPTANVYGASKEVIRESHYDLPKDLFVKDGVYIYKFVALDKAGNPSKEIGETITVDFGIGTALVFTPAKNIDFLAIVYLQSIVRGNEYNASSTRENLYGAVLYRVVLLNRKSIFIYGLTILHERIKVIGEPPSTNHITGLHSNPTFLFPHIVYQINM